MNKRNLMLLVALATTSASTLCAAAPVLITTGNETYNQNFDTLTTSTTNQTWTNGTTITGWHLFNSAGTAMNTYVGGNGSSNAGSFYSFGSTGSTDRALGGAGSGGTYFGSPAAGSIAGYIALEIQNTAGAALNGFTVTFNGEQWRNGGNTNAQPMVFEYGFGAGFGTVASWVAPGAAFNWSSVVNTATGAAVDGNAAGRVNGVGGTVSAQWNANDTLWLRWTERNDLGNDHGLAVDNLAFTAGAAPTPVPLPPAIGLLALGLLGLRRRVRRQGAR